MTDARTASRQHDEAPEISARTGFAGNRLVRDGERRTDATLEMALCHPEAKVFLNDSGRWILRTGEASPEPGFDVAAARQLAADDPDPLLLGTTGAGAPRLAMRGRAGLAEEGDALAAIDLRSIALQGLVDPDTEGQLGQAAHLLNWHEKARHCGRCGAETVAEAAGYRRRCLACGDLTFPRTDPVAIMLVHDGDGRCILGRQPRFVPNFWSCLAGFIEPGETIEDAVRRETMEEAGIVVGEVRYLASQPWPFPGSLMIGCLGRAKSLKIDFDGDELEACRWFARDEVRAMMADTHPEGLRLPQPFAIAHHLIKAFADGSA